MSARPNMDEAAKWIEFNPFPFLKMLDGFDQLIISFNGQPDNFTSSAMPNTLNAKSALRGDQLSTTDEMIRANDPKIRSRLLLARYSVQNMLAEAEINPKADLLNSFHVTAANPEAVVVGGIFRIYDEFTYDQYNQLKDGRTAEEGVFARALVENLSQYRRNLLYGKVFGVDGLNWASLPGLSTAFRANMASELTAV
jgi:hypothetical protein